LEFSFIGLQTRQVMLPPGKKLSCPTTVVLSRDFNGRYHWIEINSAKNPAAFVQKGTTITGRLGGIIVVFSLEIERVAARHEVIPTSQRIGVSTCRIEESY
jgi:hypothetical protein